MMRVNQTQSAGAHMLRNAGQAQRNNLQTGAQLSSGNRLTSAAVDVAGMAIANRMLAQFTGFMQADRNVQDGMSMLRTAEGGLAGIGDMTNRINELTVQAANDTLTQGQRQMIQDEINQLTSEVGATAGRVQFNNQNLLDGTFSAENGRGAWIQSGPNAGQGERVFIGDMREVADSLSAINVVVPPESPVTAQNPAGPEPTAEAAAAPTSGEQISQQIGTAQAALSTVTAERASLGASINRMEHQSSAIGVSAINIAASRSRIADTDMARTQMRRVQENLLEQTNITLMRNLMQDRQRMQGTLLRSFGL